jgi:ABC-type dipeptide/oligopeptide/nickel transport system permease component
MFQYIFKRLLLMIPTFFIVSLVIFLVLNLAPGRPGPAAQGGDKAASQSANQNEAYRIFKQQFNLDKPIMLNTRFALEQEDVDELVGPIVLSTVKKGLPEDQRPPVKVVVAAQNDIEDLGLYAIPQLVHIATTHADPDFRCYAVQRLSVNARRPLLREVSGVQLSAEERKANKDIDTENTRISSWKYNCDAPAEEQAKVQEQWKTWFESTKDRYAYSFGDKVGIFFFDTRFAKYWSNLMRLDLGISNLDRKPIFEKIVSKLKYTLPLSFITIFVIYLLAVPLGIFSAVKQGSTADRVSSVVLFMLYSLPTFFVGVLLLKLLSIGPEFHLWPAPPDSAGLDSIGAVSGQHDVQNMRSALGALMGLYVAWSVRSLLKNPRARTPGRLILQALGGVLFFWFASVSVQVVAYGSINLFPTGGFETPGASEDMTTLEYLGDVIYHMLLPVFCLTYGGLAALSRYARTGLLDVIRADYIRTARAKGLSEPVVIIKHAVRNGMIPILTLLGTLLPALVGGSVVIEYIFNIPGMGQYLFSAITLRDYNVVMGVLLFESVLTLFGLLLSDISYAQVDPRISFK